MSFTIQEFCLCLISITRDAPKIICIYLSTLNTAFSCLATALKRYAFQILLQNRCCNLSQFHSYITLIFIKFLRLYFYFMVLLFLCPNHFSYFFPSACKNLVTWLVWLENGTWATIKPPWPQHDADSILILGTIMLLLATRTLFAM